MLRNAARPRAFTLALGLAALGMSHGQDLGRWISGFPNMPKPRANAATVLHAGKIYVIGGFDPWPNPSTTTYIYDLKARTWSSGAAMPQALHHSGNAAVHNGKIYVMGGVDHGSGGPHPGGAEWTGSVYTAEYDIATNKWRALKPLPRTTAAAGVAAYDGKIYVIGGVDIDGVVHTDVQIYDPVAETWSKGRNMITARDHPGIDVVDGIIYVAGGCSLRKNVPVFEAYNPKTDTWTSLPPMIHTRADIGFVHHKGRFYSFGGEWPGIYDDNEEYNIATRTWRRVQKMPRPWKATGSVVVGDTIYNIAGFTDAGITAQVIAFIPPAGGATAIRLDLRAPARKRLSAPEAATDALLRAVDAVGRKRHPGAGWDAVRLFDPASDIENTNAKNAEKLP